MKRSLTLRTIALALTIMLMLAAFVVVSGCSGKKAASPAPAGSTALQNVEAAQSSLSTMAPDAKLLIVQTAAVVATDSVPTWQYLFGSPKSNTLYAVTMKDGKADPQEYGTVTMTADEWAAVPAIADWKIDSDVAHTKALTVYKNGTPQTAYLMGMVTYVPKSATGATNKPMVWDITFDPASRGDAATTTVNVSATTGEIVTK